MWVWLRATAGLPRADDQQDRHFLELLVASEIHALAHPVHGYDLQPVQTERIHRHAARVRRVACERIGHERLIAYCDRVKEAFDAYMHGGWMAVRFTQGDGDGDGDDDVTDNVADDTPAKNTNRTDDGRLPRTKMTR